MSNYLDDFLCEQQSDEYEHFQNLYDCEFFESEDEFQAWLQFQEEENSINHEDEYLTSLKNYDIINM